MPDWFTHTLFGWIIGKTSKLDIGIVVIGSIIPDLVKIDLAFNWLGFDNYNIFYPLHTPIGAFLVSGIFSVFFVNSKKIFMLFSIGIISHFFLDFFLVHASGGMKLLFPFNLNEFGIYLIRYDDFFITIYATIFTLIIFVSYKYIIIEKVSNK